MRLAKRTSGLVGQHANFEGVLPIGGGAVLRQVVRDVYRDVLGDYGAAAPMQVGRCTVIIAIPQKVLQRFSERFGALKPFQGLRIAGKIMDYYATIPPLPVVLVTDVSTVE